MLPKKQKFTSKDFEKLPNFVLKKATFPFGLVYFIKEEVAKSAIVVSKKHIKNAVHRNATKRVFFRFIQQKQVHLVIFIKKKVDLLQFRDELYKLLEN